MTPRSVCAVATRNTYRSQYAAVVPFITHGTAVSMADRYKRITEQSCFNYEDAIASKWVGKTSRQGFGGCPQ
jgi:hypothetical protein